MYKAVEDYLGFGFAVIDESGMIVEYGYATLEEAKKAARNFNECN